MPKQGWIVFLFLFSVSLNCFPEEQPPFIFISKKSSNSVRKTRVMIAPVISFYQTNKNHASGAHQKMSGLVSIKEEWKLTQKHNFFFSLGVEYMIHGLNFNSYYFKQDSIRLYNGNMDYTYSLYMQEIDVPLQTRISFLPDNNNLYSPYVVFGYHFRTLLNGNLSVKQNGEKIEHKSESINFKNPLLSPKCNPFLSLTIGVQQNNPNTTNKGFFAELTYRWGFSPYLLQDQFTASSLYITGNHLSLGLGYRF